MPASAPLGRAGSQFIKGYVAFKSVSPEDTPICLVSSFSVKDPLGVKELVGPESVTAMGVGITERKVTIDIASGFMRLDHLALFRGSSIGALASVAAPVAAIVPTRGVGTGATTIGWVAVAYSIQTPYGETGIGAPVSVDLTAIGDQLSIALLTPPAGSSINYYISAQSYATSAAALDAPLYFGGNGAGGAGTILAAYGNTLKQSRATTSISTARRVLTANVTDEPALTDVHYFTPGANPNDTQGSDLEMIYHNCLCTSFDFEAKSKDWAAVKMAFNVYGGNTGADNLLGNWIGA